MVGSLCAGMLSTILEAQQMKKTGEQETGKETMKH